MTLPAPRIDSRTSEAIVRQLLELIRVYTDEWEEFRADKGASLALIEIFGRFSELIIERLNHVPEKNLLAFLDMIGASQLPPQPARAPLTFSLVQGSVVDGLVPAATQVAAMPAEGEPSPVIFETEEELVVTVAQLTSLFVHEPERHLYADNSFLINSISPVAVPAFEGNRRLEHILYLGHATLFSYPRLQQLQLDLQTSQPPSPFQALWEKWDGKQWAQVPARLKPNGAETTDGEKYLTRDGSVFFTNLGLLPTLAIAGFEKNWLRCRLLTPIAMGSEPPAATIRNEQLPELTSINITAMIGTAPDQTLPVEAAFNNTLQVNAAKVFLPFGEKPRIADTLYLANREAFSEQDATVTLDLKLVSPVASSGRPQLSWEFWDGQMWSVLDQNFSDGTNAFTQSGLVKFTFPTKPVATNVNGVENFWIRVRLVSGNYGEEMRYEPVNKEKPAEGYKIIPATFAPPAVSSITVAYALIKKASPEVVLAYNDDLSYEIQPVPLKTFKPFQRKMGTARALYFGFALPSGVTAFPNRKISLYAALGEFKYGDKPLPVSPSGSSSPAEGQPELVWEYSTGTSWSALTVRDDSENLKRSGLVEFLAPPDFGEGREFGLSRYWLRAIWKSAAQPSGPWLRGLLLNTTMAAQAVTIKDETLGSSDGSKSQRFQTTRAPVLEGQRLEVREPEIPPAQEQLKIKEEGGKDAIRVITDQTGRPKEIWVRWSQVPDFYGSAPRDRHYMLDNLTGEIYFGDGQHGLIPPTGVGNLLMSLYRNGGGAAGNRPEGVIKQLKTTVPYVDRVGNYLPATGGTDAETKDSLLRRAPRMLRHGHRAVTLKDYEDMAGLATPEVARAKCIPLANVVKDEGNGQGSPEAGDKKLIRNGTVSLIVVPRSVEAKPSPGFELISRIEEFIGKWQSPHVELIVTGPKYVGINVAVEVASETLDGAGELKLAIAEALSKYLHPLYGGIDGNGWDFGRYPHESNLYALIEAIPGVDHVRSLQLSPTAESVEAKQAGSYFLVYSGTHTINLRFGEK